MNAKGFTLCSVLLVAAGLSVAFAAPPVTRAVVLSMGDTVTGPLPLTQPMRVVVALKLRNKAQLDAFLQQPRHPLLTPAQFAAQYSPSQSQAQQVANFLNRSGFTNVTIAPNRLLVSGDATAAIVQATFKTSMVRVRTHNGREAYANSTDVQVPAALQSSVQAVLGLQNVHIMHTLSKSITSAQPDVDATGPCNPNKIISQSFDSVSPMAISCRVAHDPTQFASIYDATGLPAASAVPVGIITWGSMTQVISDLNTFTSRHNLPLVSTQVVQTGSLGTSDPDEWDLDSQDIVGMSGGVQQIVFYVAPGGTSGPYGGNTDSNLTTAYNAAVAADAVKVINVSIGGCETVVHQDGSAAADDQIFQQAVAQGQTFSVSSGDSGADECGNGGTTPSWPASSQYVVSVGGTSLFTTQYSPTQWATETVWNDGTSSATGGSPSTFEPMPTWQHNVGQNAGHSTRGVPDIAFDASPSSGALVIVGGQQEQIGGTSLASPLFVGAWARILEEKGEYIGFAAPLLYQAAIANYAGDFHDVTVGNNNGETATTGWDYTTGFGSLVLSQISKNIIPSLQFCCTLVDINGDGKSDLLWRSKDNSQFAYWIMNGAQLASSLAVPVSTTYWPVAAGDFNGDGKADIIWTDGTSMWMWVGNGSTFTTVRMQQHYPTTGWAVVGAADFNGDGDTDLLWAKQGELAEWLMNGPTLVSSYTQAVPNGWRFLTTGNFEGGGKSDLLLTNGAVMQMWINFNNGQFTSVTTHAYPPGWTILGAGDVNGDGNADLLWRDNAHTRFAYWIMNGPQFVSSRTTDVSSQWQFGTAGDFNGDGLLDLVWYNQSQIVMWPGTTNGVYQGVFVHSYPTAWTMLP